MNNINYELLKQMQAEKNRELTIAEYRKYIDNNINNKMVAYNYLNSYIDIYTVTDMIQFLNRNPLDGKKFDIDKIATYIVNNCEQFKSKKFIAWSYSDISRNIL